jgi:CheY-like chemotaxis protein
MKPKALVVEDDDRIIDAIGDALFSIGHEHEWATNQHDAQQVLQTGNYSYVLLDLQIPAKPQRGGADKEFGVNLLANIQEIKGPRKLPVIVMTAHSADCLDLTTELFAGGASDFIAKPFANKGRTLTSVIRKVLTNPSRPTASPMTTVASPPATDGRFAGGELVFFPDRALLCGVKIITNMGAGQSLMLLRELRRRDQQGKFVRRSAEELVAAIRAPRGVGTISGCVRAIRRNVIHRLHKHLGLTCEARNLIQSDEQGYSLREWITVRDGQETE